MKKDDGIGLFTNTLFVLVMCAIGVLTTLFIGCGGEEAEEVPESFAAEMLGAAKTPEAVAMAPQAPGIGVPFVQEVKYFHNWELTREVQEAVSVGDTIFVKVVFSEPMKHVVSDDKSARPILYRRRAEKGEGLVRFRMAAHGSGGEDFVSGDAKPLRSGTDDYICKYTVAPEDAGKQVAFMIGKFSVDLEGNPLAQFYRHAKRLRVESIAPRKPETPEASPEPAAVDPLTITTITHYRDRSDTLLPEGESVEEGTTIRTEITFAEPIQAEGLVITYPHPSGRKQLTHSTGVHWRGTYQLSRDGATVRTKLNATGEGFSLTIEAAIGRDGSALKESVTASEIPVVLRVQPTVPQRNRNGSLIVNGKLTAAAIEEYRALYTMVQRVRELWANTKDIALIARPNLLWHFVTGIEMTVSEWVRIDIAYRELNPNTPAEERSKRMTATRMEYLRIQLANPNNTAEEHFTAYTESIKNGTVDIIFNDLLDKEWGRFFVK